MWVLSMLRYSKILTLLFLVGALRIQGQSDFQGGILFGGITSQVSGDNLAGFDQFGLTGGAFVDTRISDRLRLEMDLLYAAKGSRKIPRPQKNDFNSYRMRLRYIEIPLMLKFKVSNFMAGAGGYAGVLVSAKEEINEFPLTGQPFNSLDAGFVFALDYAMGDNWMLTGRYSQSLLPARDFDVNVPANLAVYMNAGQYNTCIHLMLGRKF